MTLPGACETWIAPFQKHTFDAQGHLATIVCPNEPRQGQYWAWKGEFLNAFPGTELALLKQGFYIVNLKFSDQFGSPRAVAAWDDLYIYMTRELGFAPKVPLIGLSRGGLYCYQWASRNPEKVACIYGDAPVCDMRSWPGGRGEGLGSADDWRLMMDAYGFASEEEAIAYDKQPIDQLTPLANAHVPILHVYGDADQVVPWQENTRILAQRYRELGGDITLIAKPGCGHHPHGLEDPTPVVDFMIKHTIR